MINYPQKLDIIFNRLIGSDIKPIIVGGFIRDSLLGIESKDIDIELYGLISLRELENILKDFGKLNLVGKSFGVCKLKYEDYDLDFSFPRRDNKVEPGHRGFEVEIDSSLDFKTASSRRDFTINAIGYDTKEKRVLDPHNGIDDLRDKILRAVDEKSFAQDPLRVLRAAQFCARFDLEIEKNLFLLCKNMVLKKMLDELPKERIFEEIKKLLLKSKKPSVGFGLLREFGTDIYTNNLDVVDEIAKQPRANKQANLALMLAGLCYNFKQNEAKNFISKLSNEKELLKAALLLIKFHNEIDTIYLNNFNNYALYKLAMSVNIDQLLILSSSIFYAKNGYKIYKAGEEIKKRAIELNILTEKMPPLLGGRDILGLGIKPSPKFSEILDTAYEAQMRGNFKNHNDALLWLNGYLKP